MQTEPPTIRPLFLMVNVPNLLATDVLISKPEWLAAHLLKKLLEVELTNVSQLVWPILQVGLLRQSCFIIVIEDVAKAAPVVLKILDEAKLLSQATLYRVDEAETIMRPVSPTSGEHLLAHKFWEKLFSAGATQETRLALFKLFKDKFLPPSAPGK